jgi:hypothetical protein
MYKPDTLEDGRFLIQPHNCTTGTNDHMAALPSRLTTISYDCVAGFVFRNNTHAVVTKTDTLGTWGQFLCWIFTPDNRIMVSSVCYQRLETS